MISSPPQRRWKKLEAEVARLKAERDAIPRAATDENDDASKAHTTALEAADHRVAEAEPRAVAAEARVAEAEEEAAALERELALVAARSRSSSNSRRDLQSPNRTCCDPHARAPRIVVVA